MKFSIKVNSFDSKVLKKLLDRVLKSLKVNYFRLPCLKQKVTVRLAPNGKGFSTFKTYELKLHRIFFYFSNLKDLKKADSFIKEYRVFSETYIK